MIKMLNEFNAKISMLYSMSSCQSLYWFIDIIFILEIGLRFNTEILKKIFENGVDLDL